MQLSFANLFVIPLSLAGGSNPVTYCRHSEKQHLKKATRCDVCIENWFSYSYVRAFAIPTRLISPKF